MFFHESFYPKPLKISLRSFRIFRKFPEIFQSQGAPPVANFATGSAGVVDTGGKSRDSVLLKLGGMIHEYQSMELFLIIFNFLKTILSILTAHLGAN
jgi:hypothetical protein